MTIAFLFLVYDKIIAKKNIKDFINDNNLYIHPKYKDQVDKEFKKYVINDLVETEWCKYSLVQATLNLLKESFKNKKNEWFFLLSHDSYPVYNYQHFKTNFNKIHNDHSIFNYKSKMEIVNKTYYKTSQWWVLKREDVKIILDYEQQNQQYFKNLKSNCPDEYYFLSVLKFLLH